MPRYSDKSIVPSQPHTRPHISAPGTHAPQDISPTRRRLNSSHSRSNRSLSHGASSDSEPLSPGPPPGTPHNSSPSSE